MASKAQYIIGVDTGGTFTDVVVLSNAGEVWTAKASTTPDDFSRGVMDAVDEAARTAGIETSQVLGNTTLFKHGSTVATNALITHSGVRVGFITTKGFEDTTEIMRAIGRVDGLSADEIKHVTWITKPEPFVQREQIIGVRERMDYQGHEIVPLNRADVMEAIRRLIEEDKVEAFAVSLMHAWANPKHEEEIRAFTAEADPHRKVYWSFGSSISQVAGEYARANTAILNSYLGPTVERYLKGLETKLQSGGLKGPLLIMQGNGGVAHREHVSAIANLQSGPAGGMIASAYVAGLLKHQNVITTDMGGTSFDVGLITEGYWRYAQEPIVERFRMLQPIIDIESIGAGGGTIAQVEAETGRLLVGPRSAGASPGPVCYDAGGEQVTVTDADLALGIIDPNYFLGGRKNLNKEKSLRAIEEKIARPLKLKVHETAAGIYDIVNAKMSDLIRRQVVRTGYLPEEFVIYAFGGAGPVHAAGFAAELGIKQIYIFATSPVFSAGCRRHSHARDELPVHPAGGSRGRQPTARCHRVGDESRHDRRGVQTQPGGVSPLLHHALSASNRRSGNARELGSLQRQAHGGNAGRLREKIRGALRCRRWIYQGRYRDQRDSRGRGGQSRQAGTKRQP